VAEHQHRHARTHIRAVIASFVHSVGEAVARAIREKPVLKRHGALRLKSRARLRVPHLLSALCLSQSAARDYAISAVSLIPYVPRTTKWRLAYVHLPGSRNHSKLIASWVSLVASSAGRRRQPSLSGPDRQRHSSQRKL
jgi:hypothetical protein